MQDESCYIEVQGTTAVFICNWWNRFLMYLYIYGSFNNAVSSFSSIVLNVWLTVNKLLEKMTKEMVLAQFKSLLFHQCSVLIFSFIYHWHCTPIILLTASLNAWHPVSKVRLNMKSRMHVQWSFYICIYIMFSYTDQTWKFSLPYYTSRCPTICVWNM